MGQERPAVRTVVGIEAEIACEGVVRLLDGSAGVEVVAATSELGHLPSYVRGHDADVLLLAPRPDRSSEDELVREVVRSLRAAGSPAPVVVLGYLTDEHLVRRALHSGASGYVLIWQSTDDLVGALRLAASGRAYVSPRLGVDIALVDQEVYDGLTEREAQIARLVALGYSNRQIAEELFLSTRTVESHRSRLLRKLGATDRRELVSWALEHHMIP